MVREGGVEKKSVFRSGRVDFGRLEKHHMGTCSQQFRIGGSLNYFDSSDFSAKPNVLPKLHEYALQNILEITAFKIERIT